MCPQKNRHNHRVFNSKWPLVTVETEEIPKLCKALEFYFEGEGGRHVAVPALQSRARADGRADVQRCSECSRPYA
jgi:hypothetical protein